MQNPIDIHAQFEPLWDDLEIESSFPTQRPLLAHYTSIATLEGIMKNDEIWLSNPLFMNDMEELRFGLLEAAKAFLQHRGIESACGGPGERYNALCDAFMQLHDKLSGDDAFDTYCICFCEHDREKDADGLLSMWRGYGANGSGAAIVFDTAKFDEVEASPLILDKVQYATREQRLRWIHDKLDLFASILKRLDVPTSMFYLSVHSLLMRFQLFALFTKHDGFREEQEWRLVYVKDRDRECKLNNMFHYHIRGDRIEPKLKFKIGPIEGVTSSSVRLQNIVDQIILGPSVSTPLSMAAVQRMLKILKKDELIDKVRGSSTPYRANP